MVKDRIKELREQGFSIQEAIDMYDTELKIQSQKDYCASKNQPLFAPNSNICYCCRKNIWERISMEKAKTELITGCPFCNRSFVE